VEIRSCSVKISGYVNAICRDSRPLTLPDGTKYVEQVNVGTFAKAIEENRDIKLKLNHNRVIGGVNDNLTLKEDNIGLYAETEVRDSEVIEAAKDGKITGWSFGFIKKPNGDEWRDLEGGSMKRRSLKDIFMTEVSILVGKTPAYAGTSYEVRENELEAIEMRSMEEGIEVINCVEKPKDDFGIKNKKMRVELMKRKG